MGCVYSKSWLQLKKISIFHTLGRPGPDFVILGYQTIWRPLKVVKWTQKWKSMWKSYIVNILDFIGKIVLFVIFGTLFSENWPFLDNFDKNLVLVKSAKHFYKNCQKIYSYLNFEPFLSKCLIDLTKNKFLLKLSENGQFSLNKVQKITNKKVFPIKSKMYTIYDFHIYFHFQVHLTTLRGLQMVWYPRITTSGPGRPRV